MDCPRFGPAQAGGPQRAWRLAMSAARNSKTQSDNRGTCNIARARSSTSAGIGRDRDEFGFAGQPVDRGVAHDHRQQPADEFDQNRQSSVAIHLSESRNGGRSQHADMRLNYNIRECHASGQPCPRFHENQKISNGPTVSDFQPARSQSGDRWICLQWPILAGSTKAFLVNPC